MEASGEVGTDTEEECIVGLPFNALRLWFVPSVYTQISPGISVVTSRLRFKFLQQEKCLSFVNTGTLRREVVITLMQKLLPQIPANDENWIILTCLFSEEICGWRRHVSRPQ